MVSPFQLLGPQSFLDSFSDGLKHNLQLLLPHKAHVYPALRYLRFLAKGNGLVVVELHLSISSLSAFRRLTFT